MLVSRVFKTIVYQSTTSGGHVALRPRVQPLSHAVFDASRCVPSTDLLQTRMLFFNLVLTFTTLTGCHN